MKEIIVGNGYVGLVKGICFSEVGVEVLYVDIEEAKIQNFKNAKRLELDLA